MHGPGQYGGKPDQRLVHAASEPRSRTASTPSRWKGDRIGHILGRRRAVRRGTPGRHERQRLVLQPPFYPFSRGGRRHIGPPGPPPPPRSQERQARPCPQHTVVVLCNVFATARAAAVVRCHHRGLAGTGGSGRREQRQRYPGAAVHVQRPRSTVDGGTDGYDSEHWEVTDVSADRTATAPGCSCGDCNGYRRQQWQHNAAGDRSNASEQVPDAQTGASSADGTPAQIWDCNGVAQPGSGRYPGGSRLATGVTAVRLGKPVHHRVEERVYDLAAPGSSYHATISRAPCSNGIGAWLHGTRRAA